MYKLKSVGIVSATAEFTVIEVDKQYRKAMKYLNEFSHIHVLYLVNADEKYCIRDNIVEIKEMDSKKGFIRTPPISDLYSNAILIDIKPYFPSEDTVEAVVTSEKKINVLTVRKLSDILAGKYEYEVSEIGRIRNQNGKIYVQLQDMVIPTSGYITVFWWFTRFDSDQYRRATECNPPYENAPRTGIFATRSPVRPNPIAMTVARVLEVDEERKRIYLNSIESFDQTPCIGICDYDSDEHCIKECTVPSWLQHWPKAIDKTEAGQRGLNIEVKDSVLSELLSADDKLAKIPDPIVFSSEENRRRPIEIIVRGARENNLQGINVSIPYGKLTAVVGVSGSGKSSLVDQTIYTECRRRMEYLSYNTNVYRKPLVDEMVGCIPAVVIKQDAIHTNAFSTVGTYTDAYDCLRSIFANAAIRHCPTCGNEIIPLTEETICDIVSTPPKVTIYNLSDEIVEGQNMEQIVHKALIEGEGALYAMINNTDKILLQNKQKCFHCNKIMFEVTPATFSFMDPDSRCPVCNGTGKVSVIDSNKLIEHPERSLLEGASSFYGSLKGFLTNPNANWIKGQVFGLANSMGVDLHEPWNRLPDTYKDALLHGYDQEVTFSYDNKKNGRKGEITRKVEGVYQIIERFLEESESSDALKKYLKSESCSACQGERLAMEGRLATLLGRRYPEVAKMTFGEILEYCKELQTHLNQSNYAKIASNVSALYEIAQVAEKLGVRYLSLAQETGTLSNGEAQRLKLLGAFKNHLSGILYIFDEPSKGLHPKDYQRIIELMKTLIQEGNTIIMVEHNEDLIRVADYVIEIGPGAGENGGFLVGEGTLTAMLHHKETQISKYMVENRLNPSVIKHLNQNQHEFLSMENLVSNNLKNICVKIPLRALTCICGVSGSGKSTLLRKEIFPRAQTNKEFSHVVLIDQTSIGKNSKSIVATYIGLMDFVRSKFTGTPEALNNRWDESYFSFNCHNGQCDTCKGDGRVKMKFTENLSMECPDCHGTRYKRKILSIPYRGRNISEILDLSVNQAMEVWSDEAQETQCLRSLQQVGLGYLKLGQGTATLSGGEASRLRLAKELLVKSTGNVLYLMDEPTTGLHFSDVENLLILIDELIKNGSTVVTIEHNKQFLAHADWSIELGPGAGREGGRIVSQSGGDCHNYVC